MAKFLPHWYWHLLKFCEPFPSEIFPSIRLFQLKWASNCLQLCHIFFFEDFRNKISPVHPNLLGYKQFFSHLPQIFRVKTLFPSFLSMMVNTFELNFELKTTRSPCFHRVKPTGRWPRQEKSKLLSPSHCYV